MPSPWHHAPLHVLVERGIYMVTAGTYEKAPFFSTPRRLRYLHDLLHQLANHHQWELRAWAVFANHYHFIASSPEHAASLKLMISKLHTLSAKGINREDGTIGRKVWHQYWDTRLTFERSYLARLNYIHLNPVHHRLVTDATAYRWCSAYQFEASADPSFRRTVAAFRTERINVKDDF